MKVLIFGSRGCHPSPSDIHECLDQNNIVPTLIISGCAAGADKAGERWAQLHGIEIKKFPANWAFYGKRAGFVRNAEMVRECDVGIAFWDGISEGSKNTIQLLFNAGKPYFIY